MFLLADFVLIELFIYFRFIVTYNILPETEGHTLEDIETHFSDNSCKLTNWRIAKLGNNSKNCSDFVEIDLKSTNVESSTE